MARMDAFRTFVKAHPMELDIAMAEVYRDLTRGRRGFAMMDGGAHKGWHTMRMLQLEGCVHVWAIEADPAIGRVLRHNLDGWRKTPVTLPQRILRRLTGRGPARLELVLKALQDDPATTEIPWMSSHSHVGRSSIQARGSDGPATIWADHADVAYRDTASVPATTIDTIVGQSARALPFIKLDLEGADILALRGAERTLTTKRPLVAFENSDKAPGLHGYTLQDVSDYAERLGYVLLDYVGAPLVPETWFAFYEAWAVPQDDLERMRGLIDRAIDRRLQETAP